MVTNRRVEAPAVLMNGTRHFLLSAQPRRFFSILIWTRPPQSRIKAASFYTKENDGLVHPWDGRVWLNPPFSRVAEFVGKLLEEIEAGRVTAAILLTHNSSDTGWFHEAANAASEICLTKGRIKFETENGPVESPPQGQAFFYFGKDIDLFCEVFSSIGLVMAKAIRTRRSKKTAAQHNEALRLFHLDARETGFLTKKYSDLECKTTDEWWSVIDAAESVYSEWKTLGYKLREKKPFARRSKNRLKPAPDSWFD